MKYIIDIPNADVSRWVGITPLGKKLYVPISVEDGNEYNIGTGIYVEEYIETDRKAIEDEVWEFALKLMEDVEEPHFRSAEMVDCFCKESARNVMMDGYQEAKAKYEAWKKQKDEVRVGDELKQITASGSLTGAKCIVVKIDGDKMNGIKKDGSLVVCSSQVKRWWTKTGRHFPEVAELLKKMREE